MKISGIEIGKDLSPNGEYHRVIAHLRKVAIEYREAVSMNDKCLLSAELEKYHALNINNGSGKYVIAF